MILKEILDWVGEIVSSCKVLTVKKLKRRHPKWKLLRDGFITGKKCAACGGKEHLQAHHKKPFHLFPELELEEKNLIVLCEHPSKNCHFVFGHLMNWSTYNHDIDNTISYFQILKKTAKMNAALDKNRETEGV
jgi:hypothetical protein